MEKEGVQDDWPNFHAALELRFTDKEIALWIYLELPSAAARGLSGCSSKACRGRYSFHL